MHVFLSIPSIIGKGLLIIFVIIIVLVCLLLFTPFVYKARITKNGELKAEGGVGWLLNFVHVIFSFQDRKFNWDVKVAGISIKKIFSGRKKKKKKPEEIKEKRQPSIMPGEKADKKVLKEAKEAAKTEIRIKKEGRKADWDIFEEGEKPTFFMKIRYKIRSIHDKLKKALAIKRAFDAVKDRIFKLIRHILPRKISGYIIYGFDDPSATGKSVALLSIFYPVLPDKLEVSPCFEGAMLECDVQIKGRLFLIYVLVHGLKIYFNKEVKIAMGRVKGEK